MKRFLSKVNSHHLKLFFPIVSLLLISTPFVFAADNSSDSEMSINKSTEDHALQVGYILLRLGKDKGDKFYPVKMDNKEQPFIDISDLLTNWLELISDCDLVKKSCKLILHSKNQIFWIDGFTNQFGDNIKNTTPVSYPQHAFVVQEDRLWLRYDILSQWLPIETQWSLSEYKLQLLPRFSTKSEIVKSRGDIRKAAAENLKRKNWIDGIQAMEPDGSFRPEFRYRVQHEQFTKSDTKQSALGMDFNAVLWLGTLKISHSQVANETDGELVDSSNTLWNYRRLDNPYFYSFETGNMVSDNSLLIPGTAVENGLKIHHLEKTQAEDQLGLNGQASPGTEIDLYYGGFILSTIVVDNNGTYSFDNIQVPGGDMVRLKFFYPDGSSEEKTIQVASDNGWLVPHGTWNSRLFTGDTTWGNLSRLDFGYGVSENFSLGIEVNQLSFKENDPVSLNGVYTVWRPIYGLYILAEALNLDSSTDVAASVDVTQFYPQFFKYEFHRLA